MANQFNMNLKLYLLNLDPEHYKSNSATQLGFMFVNDMYKSAGIPGIEEMEDDYTNFSAFEAISEIAHELFGKRTGQTPA